MSREHRDCRAAGPGQRASFVPAVGLFRTTTTSVAGATILPPLLVVGLPASRPSFEQRVREIS